MKRRGERSAGPLVPERIGRYDVLLPIASGGMGTVYLARSRGVGGFEREVALKVMHAHLREEEGFASDLIEEAKLAVRIQHPNVVQVLDVGEDPHGVFLVMEYIEGDSLAGLIRTTRKRDEVVPPRIGLRILVDALLGLHAAHELRDGRGELVGLVHRDFSPQNILAGLDGASRLTDFGVAKAATRASHTATGLVKGKIHYMSPEQARTETIDRRADVWAGGVMAWEMLAGRRLYKDKNDASILLKLITEPPPRLRTVRPDIPQALEDAVAHALATDMLGRCPSAKQLAQELVTAAGAIGSVASQDEVAAYVRKLSGQALGTRREQVSEVLKLRQSISSIAAASTVDSDELSHSSNASPSSPSLSDDTTASLTTPLIEEPTQVTQSSQSVPVRPRAKSRGPFAGAVVVGVLAVAAGGYFALRAPVEDVAASSPSASEIVVPLPSASPPPVASSPAPALVAPAKVSLRANAPVAQLVIGTRVVAINPPAAEIDVELAPGEGEATQEVLARAADGRSLKLVLPKGARELAVAFVATAPRSVHPGPRSVAPLATNPHRHP
jgi:eukaryotic-like serine/threonine-protein kinase